MVERRELRFSHLTEVMPEVDRLLNGYTRAGNWTLGQTCQHLALSLTRTVEGLTASRGTWLIRWTIGPWMGRRLLSSGRMPDRIRIRPEWGLAPGTDLDDRAEAEALRGALRYYAAYAEPFPDHPAFGPLSRAQWDRLHCIHCAHHLRFLLTTRMDACKSDSIDREIVDRPALQ